MSKLTSAELDKIRRRAFELALIEQRIARFTSSTSNSDDDDAAAEYNKQLAAFNAGSSNMLVLYILFFAHS